MRRSERDGEIFKVGRGNKKEAVTVSFHYLVRVVADANDEPQNAAITLSDYRTAMIALQGLPIPTFGSQQDVDKLRFSTTVPIYNLAEIETNLFFGMYKGVYSGHSYENTAKGKIPFNSASLRQFYFIVYRSPTSGRVYIGTQYLGQFGAYTELKNTIVRAFDNKKGIEAHSIRSNGHAFQKAQAKEIVVEYMRKGDNVGKPNTFSRGPKTFVIKSSGSGDDFAIATRKRLFSLFSGPKDKIRSEVSKILAEADLISVADDEILNCTVIASVDGENKRYNFINDSKFATQFGISVGRTPDGHPVEDQTRAAMRDLLKNSVLVKAENV